MVIENDQRIQWQIYLVSACLVGLNTRYDGQAKPSPLCLRKLKGIIWIPVCPEQLGGLPTPRPPAEIVGGNGNDVLHGKARVINGNGEDVSDQFINGAQQVLKIAMEQGVAGAYLKSCSPSCGISELGVLAALLKNNGVPVREF